MSYSPTTQDLEDYYAGRGEQRERPALPGDFRFEITLIEEPDMGCTHIVRMIDDRGVEVEHYTTDDPYGHVDQFRRYQSTTFEEHFAPFGPAWEDEMRADGRL